ncbi:MAG TPA: O-methyltransferase [Terriglobales bacterium]
MSATPRFTQGLLPVEVEEYLYRILPQSDPVFRDMESYAAANDVPIVGPAVGRLLFQLAKIAGAKRIFEMGSAIGYSTLWWALAVGEGGQVFYTDSDRQNAARARESFERAGVSSRVEIKIGDALEILSERKGEFDIIFNDVDKPQYPQAFKLAAEKIRRGGLYVADNVLWSGNVARKSNANDESTKAIVEHNRLLYERKDFFSTIIPLRDGVGIALKL